MNERVVKAWGKVANVGVAARRHAERDYYSVHLRKVERLRVLLGDRPFAGLSVLDIGCGYHYPQVVLFAGKVARVDGLDVKPHFYRDRLAPQVVTACRDKGLLRGAFSIAYDCLFYHQYYRHLRRVSGLAIPVRFLRLATYAGHTFPFSDGSFDVLMSSAVLEHVTNVEHFASECSRVLAPDGVMDMWWHNWCSPSGSHLAPEEKRHGPWGHLLGDPTYAGLNGLGADAIAAAFAKYLQDVRVMPADAEHRIATDPGYMPEAEDMLSAEVLARLAPLSAESLTTTGYVIQARKRLVAGSPCELRLASILHERPQALSEGHVCPCRTLTLARRHHPDVA